MPAPEIARVRDPRRVLLAAAAALAAVGALLVAAGSVEDGDVAAATASERRDTTSTTAPSRLATATSSSAAAAPSTTAASTTLAPTPATADSPRTTIAAPPLDLSAAPVPAPIEPGPLVAPAIGAYREHYVGPRGSSDGTLAVTRRGDRTTSRRRVENSISSRTLRFDGDGAHLLVTDDGGGPCTYDAPPLHVPAVLDVGSSWTIDATCTTTDGVSVRRQEEASVSGRARTTVDDVPVDTFVVQRHVVETATRSGLVVVSETASSELLASGLGLVVYSVSRTDVPDADGTIVSTAVAVELQSTSPG